MSAEARPPSALWLVVSFVTAVLAAAALIAGFVHQSRATRPIGEGQVFVADTEEAADILAGDHSPEESVRHARNVLGIEAVSLVDAAGTVVASTSPTLEGLRLSNPLLGYAISERRAAALAVSMETPIEIDGVVEWPAGSVLYQWVAPVDSGGHVMLHYDVSELLARRSQPGEIQTTTVQLLALAATFAVLAIAMYIGHGRAVRRHHEVVMESELLRAHSRELEDTNRRLAEARRAAERALALAEEKMRIRSEFVLMINHELRTPLTSVVTGAELLSDDAIGPDDRMEVLESMVTNGRRLEEIIDQILAVARIENRGLSYELSEVALDELCSTLRATPKSLDHVHDVKALTDVRTLSLVVSSMVENARTHGATKVEVTCSLTPPIEPSFAVGEPPEPAVFLAISDNGPGIDPDFLPRVFEKFEKKGFASGTGLGLYTARLMVDALGGAIGVRTSEMGTVFQIALPAVVTQVAERV